MQSLADIQKLLPQDNTVLLNDAGDGYWLLDLSNVHAHATIALHGAHVMKYQPHDEKPVLWLSDSAVFKSGTAIRGGIPVCWPWFAKHADKPALPAHGLVRTKFWRLERVKSEADGATRIIMSTTDTRTTRSLWPFSYRLELEIVIGKALQCMLKMINTGDAECSYTGALHSYLHVGDISQVSIEGLEGAYYLDKLDANRCHQQQDSLLITGEVDRIYLNTINDIVVNDFVNERKLRISKQGSHSTVIWNPWREKSSVMADFDNNGFSRMVCIEPANAADDVIRLQPGQSHVLGMTLSSE